MGRAWMKQDKVGARLLWTDEANPQPVRPRGMHRRTFDRLLGRWWEAEAEKDLAIMEKYGG